MSRLGSLAFVSVLGGGAPALATPVSGRLELPAIKHAPSEVKGFIDRVENPKKPVQDVNVAPYLLVILEGAPRPDAPAPITWELAGDSFARHVIGAPAGSEVVIKNCKPCRARTLRAAEDPKLLPVGPTNPDGSKSFRVALDPAGAPRVYTISDPDAPHLIGKIVVVPTPFVSGVEVAGGGGSSIGRFDFGDVPEGTYKLRVFYRSNWIDRPDDTVTVPAKGKLDVGTLKLPAGYPLKK